jgi:AcrR family transcriptional regulator
VAILRAAREVFGERGLEAPLEEVALRAGVGSATLYRRFPSKVHLIEAVFEKELRAYTSIVERGIEDPDSWRGFVSTITEICALQAADRALADLVTMIPPSQNAVLQDLAAHGSELVHHLVERAHDSGDLRADFTPQDVVLLFMSNAGVVHRMFDDAPDSWRRIVGFVLDGLHDAGPLGAATEAPPESAVWNAMGRV